MVEDYVVEYEKEVNSYVGSALIGMYGKCGDLLSARRVFDKIGRKVLVSWNAIVTGRGENEPSRARARLGSSSARLYIKSSSSSSF